MSAHTDLVQGIAPVASALLILCVLELSRRRLLIEDHAVLWLLGGGVLLLVSLRRGILDTVASWLGIHYAPAVLVLVLVVLMFLAGLYLSVVISRQHGQIVRLIEDQALLEARLRELQDAEAPKPSR